MATHDQAIVDRLRKRVIYFGDGCIVGDAECGGYYLPEVNAGERQVISDK